MTNRASTNGEKGEATIEFVGLVVVLVVPLFYFILTLAQVQATVFAAESASASASKLVARNAEATAGAHEQIAMIFADFGLQAPQSVDIGCTVCEGPERNITVTVQAMVQWPLVPQWMNVAQIPISASATTLVEQVSVQ